MKWLIASVAIAGFVLIVIGLYWITTQTGGADSPATGLQRKVQEPHTRADSSPASTPAEAGATRSDDIGSLRGVSESADQATPRSRLGRLIQHARLIDETRQRIDRTRLRRVRVLETNGWPRFVRVVELLEGGNGIAWTNVGFSAMAADHILVQVSGRSDTIDREQAFVAEGLRMGPPVTPTGLYIVEVDGFRSAVRLDEVLAALGATFEGIEFAEPDYLIEAAELTPDDSSFHHQWALRDFEGGIDAPAAWESGSSAAGAIVAVVDSGLHLSHRDLEPNLWVNPGEVPGNGIDDDGNGIVDDVHGYNAIQETGDPSDDNGHGSHVAGIIGAKGNNGFGISGVAWSVPLMGVKFLSSEGTGLTSDAVGSLDYARTMGADIINASWGSTDESSALLQAVQRLEEEQILLVAAAGNEGQNLNSHPAYPASLSLGNVITVAATDSNGEHWSASNYGPGMVDLAAPGVSILSTISQSDEALSYQSGTSMAAPHVSGSLALLLGGETQFSPARAIARLRQAAVRDPRLDTKVTGGLRLRLGQNFSSLLRPPENDDLSDAFDLRGDLYVWSGNTIDSGLEADEPSPPSSRFNRSIWFSLEVEAGDRVSIKVRSRDDLAAVSAFSGNPARGSQPLASSTGVIAGQEVSLLFDAPGGLITLAVYGTSTGSAEVSLKAAVVPANDNFEDAIALNGPPFEVGVRTQGGGRQPGEPIHGQDAEGRSVWYRIEAPRSGLLQLSSHRGNLTPVVSVYQGTELNALTRVATNNPGGASGPAVSFLFEVSAGQVYWIAVDAVIHAGASVVLSGAYGQAPMVTGGPTDLSIETGETIRLFVSVAGTSPFQYQWFKNGKAVSNATQSILEIADARPEDTGRYRVTISNPIGSVESRSAAVEVGHMYPIIRSAGTSRQVATGSRIVLSMAYGGAEPLSFQWYKDGNPVAGATEPTLALENAGPDDAGNYVLRITNAYGSFDSEFIRLIVADASALSWSVRYPEARLIGMNCFVDMGEEVWALGDGRIQVWHEDSGWETRDLGYDFDATDGVRVGERYFLSGKPGAILESDDGYAWTYTSLANEQDGLKLAAGNGRMLAMGRNAGLWVSEGSGQWDRTDRNFATNTYPDLIFFEGQFFLATRDGIHGTVRLNRSADGVTWTEVTTVKGGSDGGAFFVIADDHLLFSVPSRVFLTSSDGLTWAEAGEPSMTHLTAYVDGVYYGRMAQWWPGLRSSTDLVHWNDSPIDPNRRIEYLHWRDGRFFLGLASEYGSDAIVTTRSLDLETMGSVPAFDRHGAVSLEGLSWLNGEFQAGQLRSGDGVFWRSPRSRDRLDAMMSYGNGFYTAPQSIASGRHPETLTIDFRLSEAMSNSGSFPQAAFGFGVHAIIGWGTVLYSEDGSAWSNVDLGEGFRWKALRFINGHFMAVGEAGMVALGRGPEEWATFNSSFPQDLRDVTFGADRYVVATGSETLLVSTDATSWQAVVPEPGCVIWDVAFGDGRFVAVGDGCAFESADGLGWMRNDPVEPDLAFREVAFGAGTFVAVTALGDICQLGDPIELAPVVNLLRGPVPYPVSPLEHLDAEIDVVDPSDPEAVTRVFRRGVEILETSTGRTVVALETRSPGDHEVVIEATNSSGLKTSQAFRYTVNDYPGISAIPGAPAIGTMAHFKGQLYRGGEWGIVQRAAGDGRWIDLPSVPDHHWIIQLFATKTWLYAVTQDQNYRAIYRSEDGFGWERIIMDPGRLEKAGALTYSSNSNYSIILTDQGDLYPAGEGTTKIVAFAGQYVAGRHSNYSQGAVSRFWVSSDGVDFDVLPASAGRSWQGPFLADGQLVARDAADNGLLLTSDLIHWEKEQVPGSFPTDWELYQAGSGLVVRSGLQAWYSDDARTWTQFTDQGFAGAVAVGDANLVIADNRVLVFRPGQDPILLGELPLPLTYPQITWTAAEGLDGFIWINAERDPYSWGAGSHAPVFRIDPEFTHLEFTTEPQRGSLRKALPGPSQSAFLVWRPDSSLFLLGRSPFTAVSSEAPEVSNHELIASDGSAWVLAGESLDTARTTDGTNWEKGELVEDYESIWGWSQFYGRAPSWLAYHTPTQQFLAGWSPGFSEPGWWRSPDGLTWSYEAVENWYSDIGSIVSNGNTLIGLYYESEIAVCNDGSTWNRIDPGIPGRLADLRLLAPDVFAVHEGLTGRIHTSKDGLNWTRADHPDTGNALIGLMVISDDQPRILSNGVIWTSLNGSATWQMEKEAGFAPANSRYLYHLDGSVFSENLLSISTLEDLSLEIPDSSEILGGRGRRISVPVRIANNAVSGSLSGTFQLTWNLTRQAIWNPTEGGGPQTVSVAIEGLAAGATVEKILELTLPDGIEAGYHHFTAWLDSESELFEINETNNYASSETPSVRVPAWTLEATAESGGQVVIAPFRLRYTDGERVSVTPRANDGYAFVGWADGPSGGIDVLNLTMDKNLSVTARFEPRYGLSLRTIGAGTITADPERPAYPPGTEVRLTATAGKHWRLAGWSGDVSGSGPSVSLSMSQDHLATAVFEQDYTLFSGEVFTDAQQLDPAVSGPNADPDGDGFNNLAEFLLGADPNSTGDRPEVHLVVDRTGAGLVFTRRIGTAGHRLSVRWSADLINWSSNGMTELVQPLNSIREIVESSLVTEPDNPVFFQLTAEEVNETQ